MSKLKYGWNEIIFSSYISTNLKREREQKDERFIMGIILVIFILLKIKPWGEA